MSEATLNGNITRRRTTLTDIIYFYKQQIERFKKIGIGNRTEFHTLVTQALIDITIKRLDQLQAKRDNLIYRTRSKKDVS